MDKQNYNYQDFPNNPSQQQNYDYGYDDPYEDNQYIEDQSNQVYQNYQDYPNLNYHTKKEYQVIPYNSLFTQLQKSVKNAQQMTALPQGWCLLLLGQLKWDVESLAEYFHNMDKYKQKIGYSPIYNHPNQLKINKLRYCEVCCTNNLDLLQNICNHSFCIPCWKGHLTEFFTRNDPFLKCMTCQAPVLKQTIIKLIDICFPDDRRPKDRYEKILCELFSSVHRNFQFCTGIDCNNCIKVYNLNLATVRCTCGKAFCFKCKCDDHSPCSCDERKIWLQSVLKEEADAKWMSVNTKLCPWCKKAVERSAGCNFMSCICGKSFCYLCSRPWQPDHKDHFKCHIYKKSQNEHHNRQKQILEKMNFYTQRFLDNQKTAEENKKIQVFQKRKYLFKTLKVDLSDSQFIDFSYKFSIQCCQTLKWINAYSYYVKWKNELQKQKFEFYQGEFQKYKVNLLKLLAVDLKKFFTQVQKQENKNPGQIKQTVRQVLLQDFKSIKTNIVNYTTMTKKYKEKFLEQIQKMAEIQETIIKKKTSQGKKQKHKQQNQQKSILSKLSDRTQIKKNENMAGKIIKYFKN